MHMRRVVPVLTWIIAAAPAAPETVVPDRSRPQEQPSVVLSEIMFHSDGSGEKWVEIANLARRPVDITDWCLSNENGSTFRFPGQLPLMPPAGLVVVAISAGRISNQRDDVSFEKDNVVELSWLPRRAGGVFEGTSGVCALYNSTTRRSSSAVDLVQWGPNRTLGSDSAAVRARIWRPEWSVPVWSTEAGPRYHGPPPLPRNGSVARVSFTSRSRISDWFICAPTDVTRGKRNTWPAPATDYGPGPGTLVKESDRPMFGWSGPAPQFRLQVARTREFDKLLINEVVAAQTLRSPRSFPEGSYFWRVRGESEACRGRWSQPIQFRSRAGG